MKPDCLQLKGTPNKINCKHMSVPVRLWLHWLALNITRCFCVYLNSSDNVSMFYRDRNRWDIKYCTGGFHGSDNLFTNMQVSRGGGSISVIQVKKNKTGSPARPAGGQTLAKVGSNWCRLVLDVKSYTNIVLNWPLKNQNKTQPPCTITMHTFISKPSQHIKVV